MCVKFMVEPPALFGQYMFHARNIVLWRATSWDHDRLNMFAPLRLESARAGWRAFGSYFNERTG